MNELLVPTVRWNWNRSDQIFTSDSSPSPPFREDDGPWDLGAQTPARTSCPRESSFLPSACVLPTKGVPRGRRERPCFSLRKTPKQHRPRPDATGQDTAASSFLHPGSPSSVCLCRRRSLRLTASLRDPSRREPRGGKVHLRHKTAWLFLASLLQIVNVSFPTYPYYFKARQLKLGQNQEVIQEFCSLAIFYLIAAPNKPAMTLSDPFLP